MIINPCQTYQQNLVDTVTPGQLVVLLYNGALRFVKQARTAIEQKNVEQSHTCLVKAQNILTELMSTLDMSQGEISENLFSLYDYMNQRLIEANLVKDNKPLDEVETMLTELRNTWTEAIKMM